MIFSFPRLDLPPDGTKMFLFRMNRHHHHRDDRNSIPDGSKNQNPTLRSHTTRTRLKPAYHSNRSKTTKHALVARKTKARKTNPRPDIICLWVHLHGAGTRLEKSKWDDEVIVSFNDDPYKHWFMPLDFSDKRYTVPVKMVPTASTIRLKGGQLCSYPACTCAERNLVRSGQDQQPCQGHRCQHGTPPLSRF
eukprot:1343835-Amorphochlora_amoeboformis.AAC.2